MNLRTLFILLVLFSCNGQSEPNAYPFLTGEPLVVGPQVIDSGYPLPIAIFSDSTRTHVHYSGWANYDDFYIADPKNPNSPIIIHGQVNTENMSFDSAANHVANTYGFDFFEIEALEKSDFYQKYKLNIAHGIAKTKLNQKNATALIQGQRFNHNSILIILTIVQDDLFEKWAGINILLMEMGYIQTFKTLPKEKIEIAINGSPLEKLKYFESVNARAQMAIANKSVQIGKINEQVMRILSDQAQMGAIQFQWDMHNDILYGTGW